MFQNVSNGTFDVSCDSVAECIEVLLLDGRKNRLYDCAFDGVGLDKISEAFLVGRRLRGDLCGSGSSTLHNKLARIGLGHIRHCTW